VTKMEELYQEMVDADEPGQGDYCEGCLITGRNVKPVKNRGLCQKCIEFFDRIEGHIEPQVSSWKSNFGLETIWDHEGSIAGVRIIKDEESIEFTRTEAAKLVGYLTEGIVKITFTGGEE